MTKPKWYLTTSEVACILCLSIYTIRKYCRNGTLTAYTDNGLRMLISSRELIRKIREYNEDYDKYRNAMEYYGWKNITMGHMIEHGTLCAVRVGHNEWERWWNQNDDAEPPYDVGAFYSRVVHIVHVGSGAENAAMAYQSTTDSLR